MKLRPFVACVVLSFVAGKTFAQTNGCPSNVTFGKDARRYTGQYKNSAYGYSTEIPAGLTGLDENNPDYQKGFTILLPKDDGVLSIDAEPNSLSYDRPQAAAKAAVGYLKSEVGSVSTVHYQSSQVASRPAAQAVALFRCSGNKMSYEAISVLTLDAGNRFLYTLTWQGKASSAVSAMRTLKAIEASWRFVTPE